MPAFGCNRFTIPFIENVFSRQRVVSGDGSEEDPFVYEHIGFRLSDRIISAMDRLYGDLISHFASVTYPGLKRFGFIYPFVGGLDWCHSMNMADTEGDYTKNALIWAGTITHNANGITLTSGSSGNTQADCGNASPEHPRWWIYKTFGFYCRNSPADQARVMSAVKVQGTVTYVQGIHPRNNDGNAYFQNVTTVTSGVTGGSQVSVAVADSLGLFVLSREHATLMRCFKRDVQITYDTANATGGMGTGTTSALMYLTGVGRNLAFAFSTIYLGFLSYNENLALYPLIQRFQAALLRAV